jgi:hypothetical protein
MCELVFGVQLCGTECGVVAGSRGHSKNCRVSCITITCKICSFHGGDCRECRLLGYKHLVRASHETDYFSVRDHSRIVLCKIWGFHGGDYKECRLLGCKHPVRASRETHYLSVRNTSLLVLCKICGFLGGDYVECRFWNVTACGSYAKHFRGTYPFHYQGERISEL